MTFPWKSITCALLLSIGAAPAAALVTLDSLPPITTVNRYDYNLSGDCSITGEPVAYSILAGGGDFGAVSCVAGRYIAPKVVATVGFDGWTRIVVSQVDGGVESSVTRFVWKDTVGPTLSLDALPLVTYRIRSSVVVTGRCSDPGADVTLLAGNPLTPAGPAVACSGAGTFSFTADLSGRPDGPVALGVQSTDAYGNPGSAAATMYKDAVVREPAAMDVNGDGRSDLVAYNRTNGAVMRYLLNTDAGRPYVASQELVYVEPNLDWRIVGDGDFDGDGITDLLWRNGTSGWLYLMPFTAYGRPGPGQMIYAEPDAAWKIVATPDLDGDGKADILWRNASTGQVYAMLLDGFAITAQGHVYREPNVQWNIAAVGDTDADGRHNEIVWQHAATGEVYVQTVESAGGFSVSGAFVPHALGLSWKVLAAGDLDGDGTSDLVWRNSDTGAAWGMLMDGATVTAQRAMHSASNFRVIGLGDYNADGKADMLWRNVSGAAESIYVLRMNGLFVVANNGVTGMHPDWAMVGPQEYAR